MVLLAMLLSAGAPAWSAAQVPVAARQIPRGVVLTAADIRHGAEAAGGDSQAAEPVGPGWITRRLIQEGEALREPAVGPPLLVRAGDEVAVLWTDGAIHLRLRGRALGDAAAGGRVLVRIDTRRRLEGVAVGPGEVRLQGETR